MSLSFLVPAFLAGLAAIVVPIVVHLRQRERKEPIRFPSLMFLARVPHRTAERRRLTNLLLLLLRGLAVTLLVVAFARPFIKKTPDQVRARIRSRALIVLLDRSMSMGYAGVWDRARDSVRAALNGLAPGDLAGLVEFDSRAVIAQPLTANRELVRAKLAELVPGGADTRFAPAFRLAREVARDAGDAKVEILLVSDLQRHAIPGLETVDPVQGATLRIAAVGPDGAGNARVVSVDASRSLEGRQVVLRVSARVASKEATERATRATLTVDGRDLTSTGAVLAPSGVTAVTFDPVRVPATARDASVRLDPDGLPADDDYRFELAGPAGVRVALLLPSGQPAGESLFLERALAISRAPTLTVSIARGAVRASDLQTVSVVVAADLAALGARSAAAVRRLVDRGGGLVVFTGSRGAPEAPAGPGWLPARTGRVIDRATDRGASFGYLNRDHPVFEPFQETIATDFGSARYFRYHELMPDSAADVLARFDDGRPAIVAGALGSGRIVMMASPADGLWNDLPLQPVFLPLVQRLVSWAGTLGEERQAFEVGDVAVLPATGTALTVDQPDGERQRVEPDTAARTLALAAPGFYAVRRDGAETTPVASYAVNPPAAESDLTFAAPAEIAGALRVSGDSGTMGEPVLPLSAAEQEARQSWWAWILLAAIGLLVVETWYAARRSGRVGYGRGSA